MSRLLYLCYIKTNEGFVFNINKEMADQTVAKTILAQLGGNRFIVMTGSKNLVSDTNSLSMRLSKNNSKAEYLVITLNAMDTYDMVFKKEVKKLNKDMASIGIKFYDRSIVDVETFDGVYNDMLQDIFTKVTGLRTSL